MSDPSVLPSTREPEKIFSIDSEFLTGKRFPYQEDISLVEDIDLEAATPGQDINWLEDIELLVEEGSPAVFDRYVANPVDQLPVVPEKAGTSGAVEDRR